MIWDNPTRMCDIGKLSAGAIGMYSIIEHASPHLFPWAWTGFQEREQEHMRALEAEVQTWHGVTPIESKFRLKVEKHTPSFFVCFDFYIEV